MNIEQLVRAEFRSVADQVVAPAMPPLEERRRTWPVVVAAAAAAALVIGGLTFVLRDKAADPEPRPIETPKRALLHREAPTIPWIDDHALYVGGEQVPGRWGEVVVAGNAWLARRRDLHVFWGFGTQRHDLGKVGELFGNGAYPLRGHGPFLSRHGGWLVVASDAGTGSSQRVTVVQTSSGRSHEVLVPAPGEVGGITDDGLVLSGSRLIGPGKTSRLLTIPQGWLRTNGADGMVLSQEWRGERIRSWVVELDGSALRRVAEVTDASISPDRQWLLDLAWAKDHDEPTSVPVTDLGTGDHRRMVAPQGWVFAPQLAPGFWEPHGTIVIFVVRPQDREYRTARCAPALGECVLVEES